MLVHCFRMLALLSCFCALPAVAQVQVLTAKRIHTGNPEQPVATAMAWDNEGRLLDVGEAKTILANHPGAQHIEAGDATVIPGLIDAHGHLMGLGYALMLADLAGTTSKEEVVSRLRDYARSLTNDAWLLGSGWDQNLWPDKAFPMVADLDAAFPDRPVWLSRIDGHAGWANSAALRLVGKTKGRDLKGQWQPQGGRIERDVAGRPTGVFIDGAMDLVGALIPAADRRFREEALSRALQQATSRGLTGVHDMGVSAEDLALMRDFAEAGRLPLRINAYADGNQQALQDLCANGLYQHGGGRLQMHGVKLFMDGALGSRGAALLQDYSDDPHNRGLLVTSPEDFEKAVRKADQCGVQVATHAIGDRGNRIVLDTYERVLGERAVQDHRWRIEHAQVLALEDIPRFRSLGLIASMQPTHATSDMPWAQDRLGLGRIAGAYAWRRFLEAGVPLALGSDFPVESSDPRLGLYAAVSRQDLKGQPAGGWLPDQRLRVEEALRGFTAGAAYAGRDEQRVGRLSAGMRADFLILGADPSGMPAPGLPALELRSTWVDGKSVYRAVQE